MKSSIEEICKWKAVVESETHAEGRLYICKYHCRGYKLNCGSYEPAKKGTS